LSTLHSPPIEQIAGMVGARRRARRPMLMATGRKGMSCGFVEIDAAGGEPVQAAASNSVAIAPAMTRHRRPSRMARTS
jgi:hypothetical protein